MSREIKSEDENSGYSDDNLEVMRTSSGPFQTYRPHKRAQTSDNSHPAKQPRTEGAQSELDDTSNMESSHAGPVENNGNSGNDSAGAQTSTQVDPEIVVISDSEDDEIQMSETHVVTLRDNNEVAHMDLEITPAGSNFTEFMRLITNVNIDPPRYRISPQQRHMWLRQQVDAENRRRRATPTPGRFIMQEIEIDIHAHRSSSGTVSFRDIESVNSHRTPISSPAVSAPGRLTFHQIHDSIHRHPIPRARGRFIPFRFHIGRPPVVQTTDTNVQNVQEHQRSCLATTIINRHTILYRFAESNINNHEQKTCVVCITEFQNGQSVRRLPCMHIFHKECVDRWIIHSMKCPICRYALIRNNGQASAIPTS